MRPVVSMQALDHSELRHIVVSPRAPLHRVGTSGWYHMYTCWGCCFSVREVNLKWHHYGVFEDA